MSIKSLYWIQLGSKKVKKTPFKMSLEANKSVKECQKASESVKSTIEVLGFQKR